MTDPRTRHPAHDPSLPPPRRKIMGVAVPTLPEIRESIPPSVRHPSRGARWGLSSAAVVTLALGIWQGLPAILATRVAVPEQAIETVCASQETVDQLSAEQIRIKERLSKQGALLCELNQGAAMVDWPCDRSEFYVPRNPPPLHKSDRSYPK